MIFVAPERTPAYFAIILWCETPLPNRGGAEFTMPIEPDLFYDIGRDIWGEFVAGLVGWTAMIGSRPFLRIALAHSGTESGS